MTRQHFGREYGGSGPENYERFFVPPIGKPLAVDITRRAALQPGERVIDVGCGTGVVARLAAEVVGNATGDAMGDAASAVTGVDINPGMLAVARASTTNGTTIRWIQASADAMPVEDESFDVAFCQLSLQLMPEKLPALREIRRVLADDGRVLLNVPGPVGPVFATFAEAMARHISPMAGGFIRQVFSLHETVELERLASEAGLRDIEIEAETKSLDLPPANDFLWQYIHSTPLAGMVAEASDEAREALERDVVSAWKPFEANGGVRYDQRVVTVTARRSG